jgi:dUTP pyrophosphatase
MNKVGKFSKVSYEQFKKDWNKTFKGEDAYTDQETKEIYDNIQLPTRATMGSAGYDFKSPIPFALFPQTGIKIPTGIRVKIEDGWMLQCFPRSGLGFKYRLQLDNTVGIVDSDYFFSDNEGHIFLKITNDSSKFDSDGELEQTKTLEINDGEGFAQGIFTQFGITVDDENDKKEIRNGGMGSTNK